MLELTSISSGEVLRTGEEVICVREGNNDVFIHLNKKATVVIEEEILKWDASSKKDSCVVKSGDKVVYQKDTNGKVVHWTMYAQYVTERNKLLS